MSENNITNTEEKKIENRKLDIMGINIDISQVLGTKIIDQYLTQLSEDDLKKIFSYISSDLFENDTIYSSEDSKHIKVLKIKERKRDQWGNYSTKEIPIGEYIKNHFNDRIKEELKKKVEEIIASDDYQERIDEIANELVEYSINGYKEDMKTRIRERLVGNVLDAEPVVDGNSLIGLIYKCIDERVFNSNRGY